MSDNNGHIIILGDGQGGGFPNITTDDGGHTETGPDGEEVTILDSRRATVDPQRG
ncbi:hypothetical protein [Actinokineospora xionganensis]|uniref:Uncharacterized protein n=1 Tax=Actinokineospora xionganensis TaxID=2684470 RepID=A0ABR7L058_9PSEU|nr:hypothetical protein [Actinokineospora xionganensis]MBC6445717.1 hypothetical protein [Actinokineospora xionganensis]